MSQTTGRLNSPPVVSLSKEDILRLVHEAMARESTSSSLELKIEHVIRKIMNEFPLSQGNATLGFPQVQPLEDAAVKRILVTGGAGFVGSHLVDKLMYQGHHVIVVDNLFTGRRKNIQQWWNHPNFEFVTHDVVNPFFREVDEIYHLACPASPPHYQYNPVKTIKTSTMGTLNMLGLAKRTRAKVLLASTSEIYGDPLQHPQQESYFGNVNTIGPRSCYDEGKRVAETMMQSYHSQSNVDIRIARIFNTFGPRMNARDGRVVSNFIIEALQNKNLTVYGEGRQTRSFQYVSDLVEGLVALMESNVTVPVNLGNPEEFEIVAFARDIIQVTESTSSIVHLASTKDDPKRRLPDIQRAKKLLQWQPRVSVAQGLERTVEYFRNEVNMNENGITPVEPPE